MFASNVHLTQYMTPQQKYHHQSMSPEETPGYITLPAYPVIKLCEAPHLSYSPIVVYPNTPLHPRGIPLRDLVVPIC